MGGTVETTFNIGSTGLLKFLDYGTDEGRIPIVSFTIRTDRNSTEEYTQGTGENDEPVGDENVVLTPNMPWSVTVDGVQQPIQTVAINTRRTNFVGYVYVNTSQTITFHLGETNTTELGGPANYSAYVSRGDTLSVGRITQGGGTRRAIPYVRVAGVWRKAEPYVKYAGEWKQTS